MQIVSSVWLPPNYLLILLVIRLQRCNIMLYTSIGVHTLGHEYCQIFDFLPVICLYYWLLITTFQYNVGHEYCQLRSSIIFVKLIYGPLPQSISSFYTHYIYPPLHHKSDMFPALQNYIYSWFCTTIKYLKGWQFTGVQQHMARFFLLYHTTFALHLGLSVLLQRKKILNPYYVWTLQGSWATRLLRIEWICCP